MRGSDVSDMRHEAVTGIERIEAPHHPVPHDLGHDRGGRDRRAAGIPVDDRAVGWRRRTQPEAIDETGIGGGMEVGKHGAQSREVRAVQPRAVDLTRGDDPNAHRGGTRQHGLEQLLPLIRQDLFGVVQSGQRTDARPAQAFVVEKNTGNDERPCERTSARLVGPRNEADAETSIESEKTLAGGSSHAAEDRR